MVCYHQGRCGDQIKIESFCGDTTCCWVHFVNGINKDVTETSELIHVGRVGDLSTIVAKMTTRMRGADLIDFRIC